MYGVCTEHPIFRRMCVFVLRENWDLNFYVYMFTYSFARLFLYTMVFAFIFMVQMLGIIMGEFK